MLSQARTLPTEPWIPTTPFEAIACDFFHFKGHYYFVAPDRLSGWFELQQVRLGTNEAGAEGLCKALRRLMVTFGIPVEISADGGPEFIAGETLAFFRRWRIRHRLSSASFPSSNGRAELAVKTAKRLLMDNIVRNGKLNNDAIVQALLTYRNTPDPGCKLSPAQILMGRPLCDSLPILSKVMIFNNPEVQPQWREAWTAKEEALKTRYVRTMENLCEHSQSLPPLRHGDTVMAQNQRGQFPSKWDRSGVVVETRGNDQYIVKLDGTCRMTLHNRRFLCKYTRHQPRGPAWRFEHPSTVETDLPHNVFCPPTHSHCDATPCQNDPHLMLLQMQVPRQIFSPSPSPVVIPPTTVTPPDSRNLTDELPPAEPVLSPTRPGRVRIQQQFYDAESGKSSSLCSVPDDV